MSDLDYLFSDPANKQWIIESLQQAEKGELEPLKLPIK